MLHTNQRSKMKKLIASALKKYSSRKPFSSRDYWVRRYKTGGNSGPGSYGPLAEFKAETLNKFVLEKRITSVIEFGCGDGNQLALARYPAYKGYDISHDVIIQCNERFAGDASKQFFELSEFKQSKAELTISLDVIFHLTEDNVFDTYMRRLFDTASRFVAIYSSNQVDQIQPIAPHVRHRNFSRWIDENRPYWQLTKRIANPFPYDGDSTTTSFSDFYFYELK